MGKIRRCAAKTTITIPASHGFMRSDVQSEWNKVIGRAGYQEKIVKGEPVGLRATVR